MLHSVALFYVKSDYALDASEARYNKSNSCSLDWISLSNFKNDAVSLGLPRCQVTALESAHTLLTEVSQWEVDMCRDLMSVRAVFLKQKHIYHLEWRISNSSLLRFERSIVLLLQSLFLSVFFKDAEITVSVMNEWMTEWMNTQDWWNYTVRVKTELLGDEPVPVPLCRPQSIKLEPSRWRAGELPSEPWQDLSQMVLLSIRRQDTCVNTK